MESNHQKIHSSSTDPFQPVLYFQPDYLKTQQYSHLKVIHLNHFFTCFSIEGTTAKSLPKSPFGGIYTSANDSGFTKFQAHLENVLKQSGVTEIAIIQPPHYYQHFLSPDCLLDAGYTNRYGETNQFIKISGELTPRLHVMEKRKLKNQRYFSISKTSSVQEIHQFIASCRRKNDLEINITEEKLRTLFQLFPGRYEIFEARRNGKLAAAVIMVLPVDSIAYYYLPATNPEFKAMSPMVSLLDHIYHYYQTKGVSYLDLGISSVNGDLQKSLYNFKKRMGADSTPRVLLTKKL